MGGLGLDGRQFQTLPTPAPERPVQIFRGLQPLLKGTTTVPVLPGPRVCAAETAPPGGVALGFSGHGGRLLAWRAPAGRYKPRGGGHGFVIGHPTKQQAANIIRYAAHPDAKEELTKAASDMNLL